MRVGLRVVYRGRRLGGIVIDSFSLCAWCCRLAVNAALGDQPRKHCMSICDNT